MGVSPNSQNGTQQFMQTASATVDAPIAAKPTVKSRFIVGSLYDGIFFIFSPLLALGLGILMKGSVLERSDVNLWGYKGSMANIFIGSFISAHLFIVFFRSHGNKMIFKLHPWRFTLVPVALFAACLASRGCKRSKKRLEFRRRRRWRVASRSLLFEIGCEEVPAIPDCLPAYHRRSVRDTSCGILPAMAAAAGQLLPGL